MEGKTCEIRKFLSPHSRTSIRLSSPWRSVAGVYESDRLVRAKQLKHYTEITKMSPTFSICRVRKFNRPENVFSNDLRVRRNPLEVEIVSEWGKSIFAWGFLTYQLAACSQVVNFDKMLARVSRDFIRYGKSVQKRFEHFSWTLCWPVQSFGLQ